MKQKPQRFKWKGMVGKELLCAKSAPGHLDLFSAIILTT